MCLPSPGNSSPARPVILRSADSCESHSYSRTRASPAAREKSPLTFPYSPHPPAIPRCTPRTSANPAAKMHPAATPYLPARHFSPTAPTAIPLHAIGIAPAAPHSAVCATVRLLRSESDPPAKSAPLPYSFRSCSATPRAARGPACRNRCRHARRSRLRGRFRRARKSRRRSHAQHLFPLRPRIRRRSIQRAIDHQARHFFYYHVEIKFRDPVALKIRRRIQKINRVRDIALNSKLNGIHLVAERQIDRLRVFHHARAELRRQVFMVHQVSPLFRVVVHRHDVRLSKRDTPHIFVEIDKFLQRHAIRRG